MSDRINHTVAMGIYLYGGNTCFATHAINRSNPGAILAGRTEATVVLAEVGISDKPWTEELSDVVKHCQRQKQGMRMIIWRPSRR